MNASQEDPLDRSLDRHNLSWKLQSKLFIKEFSVLPGLQGCCARYLPQQQTWNRCELPLCHNCSRLRASRAAAQLRRLAISYPYRVMFTTSLAVVPAMPLVDAWNGMDDVTAAFTAGRWLNSRVAAYRRHTEGTKSVLGWHPHNVYLFVLENEPKPAEHDQLVVELQHRWESIASKLGYRASGEEQRFQPLARTPGRAINYMTKGPMGVSGENSRTFGAI